MPVPDPRGAGEHQAPPCLVGLQLLHTKASDCSLWNAGRPRRSYCSLGSPREQLPQSRTGLDLPQVWQECQCVLFGVAKLKQPFLAAVWPSPSFANVMGWVAPGHSSGMCQVTLYFMALAGDKVSRSRVAEGDHAEGASPALAMLSSVRSVQQRGSRGHRPSCLPCRPLALKNSQNRLQST